MEGNQARPVRLPTLSANSVSILREMSSAFTECVSEPLQKIHVRVVIFTRNATTTGNKERDMIFYIWRAV